MQSGDRLISLLLTFLVVIIPIYAQYRYGDIRLVGGSYQWEGRVEIFISGTWGTITDSEWTNNDSQVVCRKLGHFKPGATAHTDAYFGEGSGPIHLDFVQCSGSEYNLTECEIRHDRVRTSHSFDVGVKCQPDDEAYRGGDIRLVGGSYNWEGRVEIYWTGTWGTISDTPWNNSDAEVVCRQLGHSENGVVGHCCGYYGEGSGAIHIQQVTCSGSERNITSCTYINNTVITSHAQDVGVECQQGDDVKEGDICLVPGSYLWQGVAEIFLNGVWGRINARGAGNVDAKVVCRQLGYNTYFVRHSFNYEQFGDINDLIHLTNLMCSGSEYRINDCQYDDNTDIIYHSHQDEWVVNCPVDGLETGDVRLRTYYYYHFKYTYPEVFLSGSWEPLTDSSRSWTQENSNVVCRELGYKGNTTYYPRWYTGSFSQYMRELIDNVQCIGTESKLIDCSHNITQQFSYSTPRVECLYDNCGYGDIRLVNGESEMEGRVEVCRDGRWGTVCDSQWTDNHTAVVCRHLGFSDIVGDSTYFTSEMFGEGSGPIYIDYISCNGSESGLWRQWSYYDKYCLSFTHYYGCSHTDDVGVHCQPASCLDGQIKLLEGYTETSGHVEICSNQRWKTISVNYWGEDEARVACNALGYSYGGRYERCCFKTGGRIHQKYFQCRGTEQELSQCDSYDMTSQPRDRYIPEIYCNGDCTDGEVRVAGGESEFEGRVEVCLNNRWGTVTSDGWTQTNTEVVCNDLGYDFTSGAVVELSIPQALSKPVYLNKVVCSSSDLNLLGCSFSKHSGHVNDVQHATIACQQPSCEDGDLKLVGGISENEGRLEVCFDQRWGTINGDGWTHADTQVACRQLGYSTSGVSYTITQSPSSLPVHLTSVGCYGSEEKLIDCGHHEYTTSEPFTDRFYFDYSYDIWPANYIETNPSMDISISCFSSVDSTSSTEVDSVSTISLIISIISLSAVIVLVAVLIIVVVIFRQRTQSNQLGTGQSQNRDTIRYATSGGVSSLSIDAKKSDPLLHDDPLEDFEVEAPAGKSTTNSI